MGGFLIKKIIFGSLSLIFLFSTSVCNPHAMARFAEGLNKGLSNRSYNSNSSNRSMMNSLKRQQEDMRREQREMQAEQRKMKREQEQMEREQRRACRDLGGRWRISRCKF